VRRSLRACARADAGASPPLRHGAGDQLTGRDALRSRGIGETVRIEEVVAEELKATATAPLSVHDAEHRSSRTGLTFPAEPSRAGGREPTMDLLIRLDR
jgi:hypothetical protein